MIKRLGILSEFGKLSPHSGSRVGDTQLAWHQQKFNSNSFADVPGSSNKSRTFLGATYRNHIGE